VRTNFILGTLEPALRARASQLFHHHLGEPSRVAVLEPFEARSEPTTKVEAMMKNFFTSSAYEWYAELLAVIIVSTRPRNVLSIRELIYARFQRTTMLSPEIKGDSCFCRSCFCRSCFCRSCFCRSCF
jgi:hypothetical protein